MIHAPSEIPIDILLGLLPFEEELVDRAAETAVGSLHIRLPSPEDLNILKAVAHRPNDLEDIRTIGQKQAGLDRPRIERWLREFGDLMGLPGLWEAVRPLLDAARSVRLPQAPRGTTGRRTGRGPGNH